MKKELVRKCLVGTNAIGLWSGEIHEIVCFLFALRLLSFSIDAPFYVLLNDHAESILQIESTSQFRFAIPLTSQVSPTFSPIKK